MGFDEAILALCHSPCVHESVRLWPLELGDGGSSTKHPASRNDAMILNTSLLSADIIRRDKGLKASISDEPTSFSLPAQACELKQRGSATHAEDSRQRTLRGG